ncbi:hypothetical protein JNJ66_00935 [Candidatus Saccharibacteria bacterium]|nr:hypothetical protein [Candidatus Saccharibacteria bacterium]
MIITQHNVAIPSSRQYDPLDGTVIRIISALAERDCQVPGVRVEFCPVPIPTNRGLLYRIRAISTADCRLWLGREGATPQRNLGYSPSQAVIPGFHLTLCTDETGPTLAVYTGGNWRADRERFMYDKPPALANGHDRWYLAYQGGHQRAGDYLHHRHRRSPRLFHTTAGGLQYGRTSEDPPSYETAALLERFAAWYRDNLLPQILAIPPVGIVRPA